MLEAPVAAETLSSPFTLPNGTVVPNRIAKAAMSECLGDRDNRPTAYLTELYRRLAQGGAGLLITGNVMVDRRALGEARNVVVEDDADLVDLAAWADAGKSHGAVVLAQVNHPGRQAMNGVNAETVAPSAIKVRKGVGLFRTPRELTGLEIEDLVQRFAASAGILVRAGFSGVEIHAAHGYLINQFLSPQTNRRTDGWGGAVAGRARFLLEVVRATRAEIGPDAVLAVKLNSADFQRGGFSADDAEEVIQMLNVEPVDLLEISGGTYESTAFVGLPTAAVARSTQEREAYFLEFAEKVRGGLRVPLMVSGGFRTAAGMAEAIEGGAVDLVGLARPIALEPDLPRRILESGATRSVVQPRRLGVAQIDGFTEIMWHTSQLQRMGRGKDPAPSQHPLATAVAYTRSIAIRRFDRIRGLR